MLHLDDLVIGDAVDCGTALVEATAMTAFAVRFVPHPVFRDPAAAEASLYARPAAASLYAMALCLGCAVRAIGDVAVLCDLGFGAVTVAAPLHPGDRLAVRAWWSAVERPPGGVRPGGATLTVEGLAPDGRPAIRFDARWLVAREPRSPAGEHAAFGRPAAVRHHCGGDPTPAGGAGRGETG